MMEDAELTDSVSDAAEDEVVDADVLADKKSGSSLDMGDGSVRT